MNTSLILNTIRERGPISRAEIAKLTKLTPATVTNITSELIKYRLILEAERGVSSGGRKPVMLRINANGYHVIGIYIGSKGVEIIASNLNANMLYVKNIPITDTIDSYKLLEEIKVAVRSWIQKNKKKKVLGIGIGVHGLVKSREGISIYAPNLGWENVPIKQELEKALNLPVFVDNDVRTMTLGENWFGVARNVSNFIFIYVGYGIGGSIVINNQLYRGITEGAGEIGHTTVEKDGPLCSCGNTGCLQALASEYAMVVRAKELLAEGGKSIMREWVEGDLCHISSEIIIRAAKQEDELALSIIREKAHYLGIGIANLINTINPAMVIINGEIVKLKEAVMYCIRTEVSKRSMKYLQNATNITFSSLQRKAVLKGSVALVLSETFNNPNQAYLKTLASKEG